MAKRILLAVIVISCASVGRMLSNAKKRKIRLLGELLAAMRVLRLRMLNSMEPVGILLRKSESELFRDVGNSLSDGGLFEGWTGVRTRCTARGRALDCLSAEELGLLDRFFGELGSSGKEEQNALFSLTIASLEEAQIQAKNGFAQSARLYTALGALGGIAVCILLL